MTPFLATGPVKLSWLEVPITGVLGEGLGWSERSGVGGKTDQHGRSTEDVGERVVDEVQEG